MFYTCKASASLEVSPEVVNTHGPNGGRRGGGGFGGMTGVPNGEKSWFHIENPHL